MLFLLASNIMRTTLDLDLPILKELKAFSKSNSFSLGKAATALLAEALSAHKAKRKAPPRFKWHSKNMGPAKIDISDKEALYKILDQEFYQKK
ncbi:MAG: antitoxin [Verrucomicrobiae bacterium]|jgi:hypothetical protein|nr:antitoxin [Verrucomicrobiae bacterium]